MYTVQCTVYIVQCTPYSDHHQSTLIEYTKTHITDTNSLPFNNTRLLEGVDSLSRS